MKEVEITCLCQAIELSDLGMRLTRGQVVHVAVEAAGRSEALRVALLAGGVKTLTVERFHEIRTPKTSSPRSGQRPWVPTPAPRPVQEVPVEPPVEEVLEVVPEIPRKTRRRKAT